MVTKTALQVWPIPAFDDNYIWCIHDGESALVVDPGDAGPVLDYLESQELTLTGILITHHHADHTGGIQDLLAYVATDSRSSELPLLPRTFLTLLLVVMFAFSRQFLESQLLELKFQMPIARLWPWAM